MAIPTTTVFGLTCPDCAKVYIQPISLFLFNSHQWITVNCNCGFSLLELGSRDHKRYLLQIPCLDCGQLHTYTLSRSQIWATQLLPIKCLVSNRDIGYLGPEELVAEVLPHNARVLQSADRTPGSAPFFEHPEVAYRVLAQLGGSLEQGKVFCPCDCLELEVEIFPGHLHLVCEECGAWRDFSVTTEHALAEFLALDQIFLNLPRSSGQLKGNRENRLNPEKVK